MPSSDVSAGGVVHSFSCAGSDSSLGRLCIGVSEVIVGADVESCKRWVVYWKAQEGGKIERKRERKENGGEN